jgi:hypothetical protein
MAEHIIETAFTIRDVPAGSPIPAGRPYFAAS